MASITITGGCCIHPVDDPADELLLASSAGMKVSIQEADDDIGSVQVMTNGRIRAITSEGRPRSVSINVTHANRATKEKLESFRGRMLCYRDYGGNCLYGLIFGRRPTPQPGVDWYDISVTFTAVTYDPEV